MRKNFGELAGIGWLVLCLIGPTASVGRAETGKISGTDGSQKPQPAIACTIESLPAEVVEEAPFEVTVSWSLPASSGQVRLNCELKGEGVDVLQAQRPMVGGTGKQQLQFTALRRSQSKHIVLACWLGTDWRQPLVPIHYARPITILSREAAEKLQRDQVEAQELLQRLAWQPRDKGNIALLNGDWPGQNRTVIDTLAAALRQAGYQPTLLDAAAFLNPFVVSPERFDLLIITGGSELPVETAPTLAGFLKHQGNLIAIGTPLYADPVRRVQDGWLKPVDIRAKLDAVQPTRVLYDFESDGPTGWTRSSNKIDNPVTFTCAHDGAGGSQRSLHVTINDLVGWETFAGPPLPENTVDPAQNVLCFWAKSGDRTKRLAIECSERDGSRWIATVPLQREWTHQALVAADFVYWQDSPTGQQRGGLNDRLKFTATARITVGLAFTHTGMEGGRHEFWIDQLGMAQSPLADVAGTNRVDFPPTELLWPSYKGYRTTDVRRVRPHGMQALIATPDLPQPKALWCPHQRPHGTGFNKNRPWRMVTVTEAVSDSGDFRGPALTLMLQQETGQSAQGWATLGSDDPAFLTAPLVVNAIAALAARMLQGVFLLEAGSEFYTVFPGEQLRLGARVLNIRRPNQGDTEVRIRLLASGVEVFDHKFGTSARSGEAPVVLETRCGPDRLAAQGYRVVAELVQDHRVIDRLQHEVSVWRPKDRPQYVTARDGDFYLQGQKWYPFGVNHMPASGIGIEDQLLFEHYLSRRAYDPEIFDRELARIKGLGMNMVSAFIGFDYHADRNLFDYLQRCDKYGLKVNLSLRPGTPMDFEWDKLREMIVQNRLAQSDTVFAYDLAWEPFLGRQRERTRWDQRWSQWIQRHYVTLEAAEKAWDFAVPRNQEGHVTNPLDAQCGSDGAWGKMVTDYRRFIDEIVDEHYTLARQLVRSVDPHHLVSFRMTVAGDPTFNQAHNMPYDFRGLIRGVDLFEPEGYGRIGDWKQVRPGMFTVAYARAIDASKPVMWAEYGVSSWDMSLMQASPSSLDFEGRFYEDFLKMVRQSDANGAVCWWYPGGFRTNENSDFGIINPDGTDRPATVVLRKYAEQVTRPRDIPQPEVWIEFNPDDPAGIEGIYKKLSSKFWQTIESGRVPGLRPSGKK
ncbi:MAG: hypothetical protein NTY19_48800 [Planctomycetota bacterium]|nr:hypothetical protein [Planctomycetota bacterium]